MKQVGLVEEVHEDLMKITDYKKSLSPHKGYTIRSVVAELIMKEAKRVKKLTGEL